MIVLYEILRQLAMISLADLGDVIGDIAFLKKQVADVLLIAKNAVNRCCRPLSAETGRDAFLKKDVCNGLLT